jgi:GNAT superfamily N-acetyltransferase
MPGILYKQADLVDVPGLVGLPLEGEAGGDHRMPQYLAGEHHPQQALPARVLWMAVSGESPVGYAGGHLSRRFGCDGELQWIYVMPAYRRAHVASELLHLLAKWFVDNGAHRICVDVGSEYARPFYGHHGAVDLNPHWMVWPDIGRVLEQRPGTASPS